MKQSILFLPILLIFSGCVKDESLQPQPEPLPVVTRIETTSMDVNATQSMSASTKSQTKEILQESKSVTVVIEESSKEVMRKTAELNATKEGEIKKAVESNATKEVEFKKIELKNRVINDILLEENLTKKVEIEDKIPQNIPTEEIPKDSSFKKMGFDALPNWDSENHKEALNSFLNSCKTTKTKAMYEDLCKIGANATDAKAFFMKYFEPYKIDTTNGKEDGLLTGYYEPLLRGSLTKKEPYIYPVYTTPRDLLVVDLTTQYHELRNYRLRGRYNGNKVVPYYSRKELSSRAIDADVVCYVDSKIELFFLEVQGSGRVLLDSGENIFVGFDNLNGYKYTSIGKYLIEKGELTFPQASKKGIEEWCVKNPHRVDELLNQNESVVFFKKKDKPATGALGIVLTPHRSVAVDDRYIPLGGMLYMSANTKDGDLNRLVMAQDTGGAIKGTVRADLFFGYGDEAGEWAGKLKAPLKLWIVLPKNQKEIQSVKLSRKI